MESKHVNSMTSKVNINPSKSRINTKATEATKKASGDCGTISESTSHTQFFAKKRRFDEFSRITREQYDGVISESSSETFGCVHGPEGKQYTESEILQRAFLNALDPVPVDRAWVTSCAPAYGWEMAKKLEFLVTDGIPLQQLDRFREHLLDFAETSRLGYRIEVLEHVTVILDFLFTMYTKEPSLRESFVLLLNNIKQPLLLNRIVDNETYFEEIIGYIAFLGCLLIGLHEDELFAIVSEAMLWHLSAPDAKRGQRGLRRRITLIAAAPALFNTTVRMLAAASAYRFPTFLQMALLLANAAHENCIELLRENILENIFYRFNPYFPERKLPPYDINPTDPQHYNVQLGDSSVNLHTTLTLLLVLMKSLKQCKEDNPKFDEEFLVPDQYAQRCFIWAYRYECRARDHHAERVALTVITSVLLRCFGERLATFSARLMPDVMSLSVATELPLHKGWVSTVNFNKTQADVQFKKSLIYLCVDFIKTFPYNKFLIESQHWFVGLMCLLDSGLTKLRPDWGPPLYGELRMTALQALMQALPYTQNNLAKKCGLTRRIMWNVEWYSWNPYELGVLYWCLRLLQATAGRRGSPLRPHALKDLMHSHGIIIVMNLCTTLISQRTPPVEMAQVVLALSLRLLASGIESTSRVTCQVYPAIVWPASINSLARNMINVIVQSLERSCIVSDRWIISLLNFIWEGIIWKKENRKYFLANNGVFQLLDLITMVRAPVQCVALALVCDLTCAGGAVSQLVSWRAGIGASYAHPRIVQTGDTIACLLAAIFRDECRRINVNLDDDGVIRDLDNPLRSKSLRKALEHPKLKRMVHNQLPICYTAADLAGSRWSKVYSLLQMLSQDLNDKVLIADEAYNLYKNIKLKPADEIMLVLCSHYLTFKLMETWTEIQMQSPNYEVYDADILEEFLHINKGWAIEIKRQQEVIVEMDRKKKHEEETSLYAFLGRVRLNTALDALREVQCKARSASRGRLMSAMLADAVTAHHRRSAHAADIGEAVLRTYQPALDDQNPTAQYVMTHSIPKKGAEQDTSPPTKYMKESKICVKVPIRLWRSWGLLRKPSQEEAFAQQWDVHYAFTVHSVYEDDDKP